MTPFPSVISSGGTKCLSREIYNPMVRIKPFAAVRPPRQYVEEVAARPYDVLNSEEAQKEAGEKSLLHITKPEIDFSPIIDEHSTQAYD